MRYVKDIPSDFFKIGLYVWNGKYIVKVEAGLYEQTYKVSEMDFVGDEGDVEKLFADETFLRTIAARFLQMDTDFREAMERS